MSEVAFSIETAGKGARQGTPRGCWRDFRAEDLYSTLQQHTIPDHRFGDAYMQYTTSSR